jgi:hypothetical protein
VRTSRRELSDHPSSGVVPAPRSSSPAGRCPKSLPATAPRRKRVRSARRRTPLGRCARQRRRREATRRGPMIHLGWISALGSAALDFRALPGGPATWSPVPGPIASPNPHQAPLRTVKKGSPGAGGTKCDAAERGWIARLVGAPSCRDPWRGLGRRFTVALRCDRRCAPEHYPAQHVTPPRGRVAHDAR